MTDAQTQPLTAHPLSGAKAQVRNTLPLVAGGQPGRRIAAGEEAVCRLLEARGLATVTERQEEGGVVLYAGRLT